VQKVSKRQLRNRCTFYYNHFDLNKNSKKKEKEDKDDENEDTKDKDYYKKLYENHLEKKGKKKYWSNTIRKSDTNNDLI
jgi:hypothetical protein